MPCKPTPNLTLWTITQTGRLVGYATGSPGTAKTASVYAFAKAMNRPCYTLIGSLREPSDFGIPYPIRYRAKMGQWTKEAEYTGKEDPEQFVMSLLPPQWVADCWDGRPWVIFLDELTCSPPPVQAAMLRILAEKVVGDTPLPPDTWFIAAANPVGQAASGYPLEPPMANRLAHLKWMTDTDVLFAGWARGLSPNGHGLDWNFPSPQFVPLPDDWHTLVAPTLTRLAAFHQHVPNWLDKYPDDRDKAAGPYPSPRSWTNGGVAMAAMQAIDAPKALVHEALASCVGEDAAWQYAHWEESLDLPDVEQWIAKAMKCRQAGRQLVLDIPARPDKVIATIGAMLEHVQREKTPQRWMGAVDVLHCLWKNGHRELVVAYGAGIVSVRQHDYPWPQEFLADVYPVLEGAGLVARG